MINNLAGLSSLSLKLFLPTSLKALLPSSASGTDGMPKPDVSCGVYYFPLRKLLEFYALDFLKFLTDVYVYTFFHVEAFPHVGKHVSPFSSRNLV